MEIEAEERARKAKEEVNHLAITRCVALFTVCLPDTISPSLHVALLFHSSISYFLFFRYHCSFLSSQ